MRIAKRRREGANHTGFRLDLSQGDRGLSTNPESRRRRQELDEVVRTRIGGGGNRQDPEQRSDDPESRRSVPPAACHIHPRSSMTDTTRIHVRRTNPLRLQGIASSSTPRSEYRRPARVVATTENNPRIVGCSSKGQLLRVPRLATVLLATFVVLVTSAPTASAQPTVHVRGKSQIEIRIGQKAQRLLLDGELRDERNRPLTGRTVQLEVEARGRIALRADLVTDGGGRFLTPVEVPAESERLKVRFLGDDDHESAEVIRDLDPRRHDVQLRLRRTSEERIARVDLEGDALRLELATTGPEGGRGVYVTVFDERGNRLADTTSDERGEATIVIAPAALGRPGFGTLVFRSAGDESRRPSELRAPVVRYVATRLAMTVQTSWTEGGPIAAISGRLIARGEPLADRAVGIFRGKEHLMTLLTAADGSFGGDLRLTEEETSLVARFEGEPPILGPSSSPTWTMPLPPRPLPSWLFVLLPVLVSIGLIVALRRGVQPVRGPAASETPPEPGVRFTTDLPPNLAGRDGLRGKLVDHLDGTSIAGARLTLLADARAIAESISDIDGAFTFEVPPPTSGRLSVEAEGYLPVEFPIAAAHSARSRSIEVRLESLRSRAQSAFREVALRGTEDERAWYVQTNREIAARLAIEPAPGERLAALADDVEAIYYGRRPLGGEELTRIVEDAERLKSEVSPRPGSPAGERGSDDRG